MSRGFGDVCEFFFFFQAEDGIRDRSPSRGLGDVYKRQVLELLKGGRRSAGELAKALDMSPAALSYHLRLLKEAGLVMEYKEKNFVYYSLDMTVFDEMIMWFKGFTGDRKEEAGQAKAGKCEN